MVNYIYAYKKCLADLEQEYTQVISGQKQSFEPVEAYVSTAKDTYQKGIW